MMYVETPQGRGTIGNVEGVHTAGQEAIAELTLASAASAKAVEYALGLPSSIPRNFPGGFTVSIRDVDNMSDFVGYSDKPDLLHAIADVIEQAAKSWGLDASAIQDDLTPVRFVAFGQVTFATYQG